jgi:predicted peroxiredoxin
MLVFQGADYQKSYCFPGDDKEKLEFLANAIKEMGLNVNSFFFIEGMESIKVSKEEYEKNTGKNVQHFLN